MSLSLRSKLMAIVLASAASLALVMAVGLQLALRQHRNVEELEQRLVPKLELQPRLRAQFEQLGQALRDAVAAQDPAALAATADLERAMRDGIAEAGNVFSVEESSELREAIIGYHRVAMGVSLRLVNGEAGEELVDAMAAMQEQYQRTVRLIDRVASLDRGMLRAGFENVRESSLRAGQYGIAIGLCSLVLVLGLSLWISKGTLANLRQITEGLARFATGNFAVPITPRSNDELGRLAQEANRMAKDLQDLIRRRDAFDWVRAGQVALSERLRGDMETNEAARAAILWLAERLGAVAGAIYLSELDGSLVLAGAYAPATSLGAGPRQRLASGEGLVGEAALRSEISLVQGLPHGYTAAHSGLGGAAPSCLLFVPLWRGSRPVGVVELALFKDCSDEAREYLSLVRESLAAAFESTRSRARLRDLLEESQTQAARLSAQEEELIQNNRELAGQQEELRLTNDELEAQRQALKAQNAELEAARTDIQEKANELFKVSAYKTQFLANMSHELRTPLNSMLLLSQLLADNDAGNLSPKQVEHCSTIYSAGKGLLSLINQVLDLSKIEAGKQVLEAGPVVVAELAERVRLAFAAQFSAKGLSLSVESGLGIPEAIVVDGHCLERILINLVGNALKFTEQGGVTLRIERPPLTTHFTRMDLMPGGCLAFSVRDTGVGIPRDAQARVFARFEQADARTARRYGGSGLGLAIARESAQLLGGELRLESEEGKGSTFTCYVPEYPPELASRPPRSTSDPAPTQLPGIDDRERLALSEPHLLIIEDDPVFAEHLLGVVHGLRLKALIATSGEEGLRLARARTPVGIVLDVRLPDMDGFQVRERLEKDPETASIPVHFISAMDAPRGASGHGVVGYLTKPAKREALAEVIQKLIRSDASNEARVLIVEDDPETSQSVAELLGQSDLRARQVRTADEAVHALQTERFSCVILDLGLPDVDGLRFLEDLQARKDLSLPPVLVHTGRALSREEVRRLHDYAQAVVFKDGRSAERLVDEVRLFVGHLRDRLPQNVVGRDDVGVPRDLSLGGAKVLIADDDMRTVYALSALLRGKGAEVVVADTGREALRVLDQHPNVQLVLMDIMMPDMDGYETMRHLRAEPRFMDLPVIALTAKAMKGEGERCQAAGASDYMAKPVDPAALLSSIKRWLLADAPS